MAERCLGLTCLQRCWSTFFYIYPFNKRGCIYATELASLGLGRAWGCCYECCSTKGGYLNFSTLCADLFLPWKARSESLVPFPGGTEGTFRYEAWGSLCTWLRQFSVFRSDFFSVGDVQGMNVMIRELQRVIFEADECLKHLWPSPNTLHVIYPWGNGSDPRSVMRSPTRSRYSVCVYSHPARSRHVLFIQFSSKRVVFFFSFFFSYQFM